MNGNKTEINSRLQRRQLRAMRLNERRIKNNFIIFELGFIFVIIPLLVLSFVLGPILFFFAVAQQFYVWPFVLYAVLVTFFEVIGIQYFLKRFYLEPHNMTLGEFLRYKVDRATGRIPDIDYKDQGNLTWYKDMDEFILRIKETRQAETERIYASAYDNQLSDYYEFE